MRKEQFLEIVDWQRETFPVATALSKIHHLDQEVQELRIDLINNEKDRRLEFADCFLLLFGAASADGMTYEDIVSCIAEKFEICKQRKWGKPDENGIVNHIKDGKKEK